MAKQFHFFNGCTLSYTVNESTPDLFGADVFSDCIPSQPVWFQPIVFWFFSFDTISPQGSATYCAPAISLWEVAVTVDIASGNLTSVEEISQLNANSTSPLVALYGNITGAPLEGRAYNGLRFNTTGADQFVMARQNATDLQLPSSIIRAMEGRPGGLSAAFAENSFTGMAVQVYVRVQILSFIFLLILQNLFYIDHISESRRKVGIFLTYHR